MPTKNFVPSLHFPRLAWPLWRGLMLCGLLWFLGQSCWACKIQIYPYLYYLNSPQELNWAVFPQHDCAKDITSKLLKLLQQQEGVVKTKHLVAALPANPAESITIFPEQVEIQSITAALTAQEDFGPTLIFNGLRFSDQRPWLGSYQKIQIDLSSLKKDNVIRLGEKQIKLTYFPIPPRASALSGSPAQILWLNARLQEKQKVLVAQENIGPGQKLNPQQFKWAEVALDQPVHYVTTLENLIYYKANKALAKNSILKQQDLIPEQLVRPSLPVTAIIEHGQLKMKNTAIARHGGSWGDTISLEVGVNKKIVAGKVIGPNKVLVQL